MLAACSSDYTSVRTLPGTVMGPETTVSPDGAIALVWDGALTNATALRAELTGAGFRLHSRSESELLLAGIRAWGTHGLAARLHGAFALAILEYSPSRLTLIRDRLGLRRLAYSCHGGQTSFCTSVRGLRFSWSGAGLARDLDPSAVSQFLDLGWVPDNRSIYTDVHKVPAGAIVEIDAQGVRTTVYWQVPPPLAGRPWDFDGTVQHVEDLLLDAVRVRLESDSTVAALLGVGLESSLLGWALAKLEARIPIYRVARADEEPAETAAAQDLTRRLGLRQEVLWVSATDEPRVAEIAEAYDEPYAAPSAFEMLRVGRAVRRQAGVLLTGDGVDWLFLGSAHHRRCWQMDGLLRELDLDQTSMPGEARELLGLPSAYLHPGRLAARFFGPRLRQWQAQQRSISAYLAPGAALLDDFLQFDRAATFDRDRAGMAGAAQFFGVEARSPFLDDALWDFVARVPYSQRLRGGNSRAILRELVRLNVSGRMAERQKANPSFQVRHLLATRWHGALEEVLHDSHLVGEGWIDAAAIWGEFESLGRRNQASRSLWHFFILEYWLRRAATQPLRARTVAASA